MTKTSARGREEWLRRYISFIFILFIIAFGTSLSIRANLGSSPISAPPYVLSLVKGAPMTMGQFTICMHVLFILTQVILLRRDFEKRQYTQILVSFLFGFYTDLTMWLTGFLQVPFDIAPAIGYPLRIVELLTGGAILAFGIACEVRCDSFMLAGEGFPLAFARFLKKDFGKVKMCTDTFLVCVAVVLMYSFFGRWDWKMVGAGTLVSMFYVGFMVRIFSPHLAWLDVIFIPKADRVEEEEEKKEEENILPTAPRVITIAREYGSGGRMIGQKIAADLGIAFYDRDIIDHTAEDLGYSPVFVAEKEQNISTARLWELIFTDKSIPPSMDPGHDDAIFVSQSRTIRRLAKAGPCVIMGRLAGDILRRDPHVLRVFVESDEDFAVEQVMKKDGLTREEAKKKIGTVNRGRANHSLQYAGHRWKDMAYYDIAVNTSRLGIERAAALIESAARAV